MNYTEEQKKDILEMLANYDGFPTTHVSIQAFAKTNGLLPLENGWYTYGDDWIMHYDFDTLELYGVSSGSTWFTNKYVNKSELLADLQKDPEGLRLATDDEILLALTKEAERRGFKEGVSYKVREDAEARTLEASIFNYYQMTFEEGKKMCLGTTNYWFYRDGQWATIIEEPQVKELTVSDIEAKYGCKVKIIKE